MARSKLTLFGFLGLMLLSALGGFQSFGALQSGGYDNPGADSGVVSRAITDTFKEASPNLALVVDFHSDVELPKNVAIADKLSKQLLKKPGISKVTSYYTQNHPAALRSTDGKAVYTFVYFKEGSDVSTLAKWVQTKFSGGFHGATVYVGGMSIMGPAINGQISGDLAVAESIAVPLTIVLLLFVFGSAVAMGLPFIVALISALGAFFVIWLGTLVGDASVFGINLVTGLALGLGIDYALLIVNRFREERAGGASVADATQTTVQTAGRTVFFSGFTVAVVMLALAFFPQYFLRTFALAGVGVVVFAVLGAITALPAMLNLLGDRVNKGKVLRGDLTPKSTGPWEKLSRFVMRRPLPILFVVILALGGLTSIGQTARFGLVDDRVLPRDNAVVVANEQIRTRFSGREGSPVEVLLRNPSTNQLIKYTNDLSKIKDVVRVQSPVGITQNGVLDTGYAPAFANYRNDGFVRVQAIIDVDSRSTDGYNLVQDVRQIETKIHYVKVGGAAGVYTDSLLGISDNLGLALIWLAITTLVLLFLFTGSVILPIKAVLLNLLSLGATLGFITWVFQEGHLRWLIGDFQVTGTIDASTMVLIAVMAFGLSMDYELFLLSRIKEQHDRGLSTTDSVSFGLQHSGRIITAAALVLAVSFYAFTTSGVSIMKMLGLGVAFAIMLDATVVRALLVPALMRLFGDANWWAPKWLKWVYAKAGLEH